MDPFVLQWMNLIVVFSVAVVAPGPDFVMAVRNSIVHSRRVGVFTAIGFALGVLVHVTYTILGLSVVIVESILLFNLMKWAGAAYLVYIGVQALASKGMGKSAVEAATNEKPRHAGMSDIRALRVGFLTNVLNPKAALFFLAIFSQIVGPATPLSWQVVYGLTCGVMVALWFSVVALVLTHGPVRDLFLRVTKWIDKVCGVLLIALGVKVAFSTK